MPRPSPRTPVDFVVAARGEECHCGNLTTLRGLTPEVAGLGCCGNVCFRRGLRRRPELPPESLPQVKR